MFSEHHCLTNMLCCTTPSLEKLRFTICLFNNATEFMKRTLVQNKLLGLIIIQRIYVTPFYPEEMQPRPFDTMC